MLGTLNVPATELAISRDGVGIRELIVKAGSAALMEIFLVVVAMGPDGLVAINAVENRESYCGICGSFAAICGSNSSPDPTFIETLGPAGNQAPPE